MRFLRSVGAVVSRTAAVAAGVAWVTLGASGVAQEAPAPTGTEAQAKPAGDLVTPYHFVERYATPTSEKAESGAIGSYRVAFRETIKAVREQPRGEPQPREVSMQVIYTERAAEAGDVGDRGVSVVVRRYERARSQPDNWSKLVGRPLLDGLAIWYQLRPGDEPLVLGLTPGRNLTDQEYHATLRSLFVPRLAHLLPPSPVRIAGTWPIDPEGEEALIAGPAVREGGLTGKLLEVRPSGSGAGRVASIEVAGRLTTDFGSTALRARLEFAFEAAPEAAAEAKPEEAEEAIEARGAIVKVSLAETTTSYRADPDNPDGRLKQTQRRVLVLERRLDNGGAELEVPARPPEPTKENSWLTFLDPSGRYSFRHPQNHVLAEASSPNQLTLGRSAPGGEFLIELTFLPTGQVKADDFFKKVFDERRKDGAELTVGRATELPAANWDGNRVVRAEAISPLGDGRGSEAIFAYVIQFARQNAALAVEASTLDESPKAFRAEVEEILKTFRLGKPADGRE